MRNIHYHTLVHKKADINNFEIRLRDNNLVIISDRAPHHSPFSSKKNLWVLVLNIFSIPYNLIPWIMISLDKHNC